MLRKIFVSYQLNVWERTVHAPISRRCLQMHNAIPHMQDRHGIRQLPYHHQTNTVFLTLSGKASGYMNNSVILL